MQHGGSRTGRLLLTAGVASLGCLGSLGNVAHAQQFVNPGFQTGNFNGWTVETTPGGTTTVQLVEMVDIDGPGPLLPSLAAKFSVGRQASFNDGGVEITQMFQLTEGVEYWVHFDWASTRDAGLLNANGGVYSIIFGDDVVATDLAGPTGPLAPSYGRLQGSFVPEVSGQYRVGARITRPASPVSELYQWVDNFELLAPPRGACCMHDGTCSFETQITCGLLNGNYRGDGVPCTAAACPPPGACCLFLNCEVLSQSQCAQLGGVYSGPGVPCGSIACEPRGTLVPIPAPTAIYTSEVFARGFWFTAPVDFDITGVRVPDPGEQGTQNFEIVRFAIHPPQTSSSPTNDFVSLTRQLGFTSKMVVPVDVQVKAGDMIGILGNCSNTSTGSTAMHHSSADGAFSSEIFGEPAMLVRLTMAGNLNTSAAHSLYSTFILQTVLARVEIYYAEPTDGCYANCDGSTTQPILNVDDFTCFINAFAQAQVLPHAEQINHYANCDNSTVAPVLNVDDFTCYINAFSLGCP